MVSKEFQNSHELLGEEGRGGGGGETRRSREEEHAGTHPSGSRISTASAPGMADTDQSFSIALKDKKKSMKEQCRGRFLCSVAGRPSHVRRRM